jgi:hypothetical protein
MKNTPFITAKKQVRMLSPGDILLDLKHGARFITGVATNVAGNFIIRFHLPDWDKEGLFNTLTVDRFWGDSEVTVILGMTSTKQASEIELLKAQLAARDAALDAVLGLAMSNAGPRNLACFEIVALLEKHGVRI